MAVAASPERTTSARRELVCAEVHVASSRRPTIRRGFKKRFKEGWLQRKTARDWIFSSTGMDVIELETGTPYIGELIRFFKVRAERLQ